MFYNPHFILILWHVIAIDQQVVIAKSKGRSRLVANVRCECGSCNKTVPETELVLCDLGKGCKERFHTACWCPCRRKTSTSTFTKVKI